MSPEAAYYWQRHAVRFEYVLRYLAARGESRVRTVLDIGGSFQTRLLAEQFPAWRIDTLAEGDDPRFRLPAPSQFFAFDLNDAIHPQKWPALGGPYDLIVFMEVIEHLVAPPANVLRFLASQLRPGGAILLTTPNAAWLKNRLKLLRGKNPFELLREDRSGHVREYTLDELQDAARQAGLACADGHLRGLYHFSGAKDRFYSTLADATFPGLRRSIFMLLEQPRA